MRAAVRNSAAMPSPALYLAHWRAILRSLCVAYKTHGESFNVKV